MNRQATHMDNIVFYMYHFGNESFKNFKNFVQSLEFLYSPNNTKTWLKFKICSPRWPSVCRNPI